jgi:hypothetical protein
MASASKATLRGKNLPLAKDRSTTRKRKFIHQNNQETLLTQPKGDQSYKLFATDESALIISLSGA